MEGMQATARLDEGEIAEESTKSMDRKVGAAKKGVEH